jgi:hypothetical protein
MALSHIMDLDVPSEKRKESILIVNNFFVSFCMNRGHQEDGQDNVMESINILENCGFFEKLEVLFEGEATASYFKALSQLLLNVTVGHTNFMREQMMKRAVMHSLLLISNPRLPSISHIGQSDLLEEMSKRQYYDCYSATLLSTFRNTIQILRLITFDSEESKVHLVSTTQIVPHLIANINSVWSHVKTTNDLAKYWDFILVSFALVSDILTYIPKEDAILLFGSKTGKQILELLLFGIRQKDEDSVIICNILLCSIFSISFSGAVEFNLDTLLTQNTELATSEVGLGKQIIQELFDTLFGESSSAVSMDVRDCALISMQCLFGRCQLAKDFALAQSLPQKLDLQLAKILGVSQKLDDAGSFTIYSVLILIRHLCAGSPEAKV